VLVVQHRILDRVIRSSIMQSSPLSRKRLIGAALCLAALITLTPATQAREAVVAATPNTSSATPLACIPAAQCCKVCSAGKACGNTCINANYNCHKGRGCACNEDEICAE
jgi:hypothetical protein